jgi:hypothetical protein
MCRGAKCYKTHQISALILEFGGAPLTAISQACAVALKLKKVRTEKPTYTVSLKEYRRYKNPNMAKFFETKESRLHSAIPLRILVDV